MRFNARIGLAVLFMFPLATWSQSDRGAITGTVRDPSKASIAQAKIRVTDVRTNTDVFTTTTDSNGRYTAPALKPSDYVISAESDGFKREVRRGVGLTV